MIIQATEKEVDQIVTLANEFSKESKFARFNIDVLIPNIKNIVNNNIGVLFLAYDNGELIGTICGIKYPDLLSGELTASELFWFVNKRKRGVGINLLNRFEGWAKDQGCKRIVMTYLSDSMPKTVKTIYEKRSYEYLESNYIKEL